MSKDNQNENQSNLSQSLILNCKELEREHSAYLKTWSRHQHRLKITMTAFMVSTILGFLVVIIHNSPFIPRHSLLALIITVIISYTLMILLIRRTTKIENTKIAGFNENAVYAFGLYNLCEDVLSRKNSPSSRKYRSKLKEAKRRVSKISGLVDSVEPDEENVESLVPLKPLIPIYILDQNLQKMFQHALSHTEIENVKHLKEVLKELIELALDERLDKIHMINEKIQKYFTLEKQA